MIGWMDEWVDEACTFIFVFDFDIFLVILPVRCPTHHIDPLIHLFISLFVVVVVVVVFIRRTAKSNSFALALTRMSLLQQESLSKH
jgi:type III secretory pathway component EscV